MKVSCPTVNPTHPPTNKRHKSTIFGVIAGLVALPLPLRALYACHAHNRYLQCSTPLERYN